MRLAEMTGTWTIPSRSSKVDMIRVIPEVGLGKRSQQLKAVRPKGLCGGLSLQLLFVDYPFTAAIKYLVMKVME